MVAEQEANKFFNCTFHCRTFSGKSNHGHFLKHYLKNYNFAKKYPKRKILVKISSEFKIVALSGHVTDDVTPCLI